MHLHPNATQGNTMNTNDTDVNLEGVMRRVRKLLAIAEDHRADPAEAAAAAGMAERIMRKFQLDHADVITASLKRGTDTDFAEEFCSAGSLPEGRVDSYNAWAGWLSVRVAQLYDCQVRYARTEKHGASLRFSGYASDVTVARFTYIYLVNVMKAAVSQRRKTHGASSLSAYGRGFVLGMCTAIHKIVVTKKAEMQATSTGRELVVVKEDAVAKHFGDVDYTKGKKTRTSDGYAFASGSADGARVDVGRRAVTDTQSKNLQLG